MKNITIKFILERTTANYVSIQNTGIYKIYHINKPNIFYIGSASSLKKWRTGFKQRWVEHIKNLKNGTHHSLYLQRTINKYGIEGIRFDILEKCLPEECLIKEQYWLDKIKPFGKEGYNTCKLAGNTLGYKFPENKKSNRKPITQYDLNGNFITNWNSLNQASRELSINVSSIKDCCKKRFNQIKGFIFRYYGDIELPNLKEIKSPMIIKCFHKDILLYTGKYFEIKKLVPDTKYSIYNSIKTGKLTKNNFKYIN
jgi:hypothetical protein